MKNGKEKLGKTSQTTLDGGVKCFYNGICIGKTLTKTVEYTGKSKRAGDGGSW